MGKTYTVAQGDHLSKIARSFGFASHLTIWDAPENKQLKDKRKNPNILFPGDRLFIPDKDTKEEHRSTDQRHSFQTKTEKLMLRIALKDLRNHPLRGNECILSLEADPKKLTTNADGIIEQEITDPKRATKGLLLDQGKPNDKLRTERRIPLKIGDLDPETKVSGQIARLNNLGYNAGEVPERPVTEDEAEKVAKSPQFRSAVEEFQCDFMGQDSLVVIKRVVDGICGEKTQAKLKEIHGC